MKLTDLRSAPRFRTERWLLYATNALFAVMLEWSLFQEHGRVTAQEGDRLEVQARVIDDNVLRQLEGANAALSSVAQDLRESAPLAAGATTENKLRLLTAVMPGVSSMLVLDHSGTVIASSQDELFGKNFRQRDYFAVAKRDADPAKLYVSPPFKTTMGRFVIVVSRALVDARERFIGVVTASLDPDYFNVVLRSVLYAPDMRATLIHGDGHVFLNMPPNQSALDADLLASDTLFRRHRRSEAALSLSSGDTVAGDERLMAIRNIDRAELRMDKPLVVAVGRNLSEIYREWRGHAWWQGLLWLAICAGSISALLMNQRRRSTAAGMADQVAEMHRRATERVELALRGADLGLWDLSLPGGHLVVSQRERQLLGYGPEDELPDGSGWREHVHPEDRARVDAAIVPHLKGLAPNYECEHRLRRKDGTYLWVSNRAMIVERDSSGSPLRIVGTHLDVTARKAIEEELGLAARVVKFSEVQLRQVADNMPALVSRFDAQQRLRFVNRAYLDWLGVEPDRLLGRSLCEVYGEGAYALFKRHVEIALTGHRVVYERDLTTLRGSRRVEVTLVPQDDPAIGFSVYALIVDITERHEAEGRLRRLAEIDALTGVPNRVLFRDRLLAAMPSAAAESGVALLFIDVDHFKSVNDTLGHEAGDELLKVFARRMQATVRQSDTVARLGGDEFTVILEGLRDPSDASMVAGNLVEALREPICLGDKLLVVTASIGMTLCCPGEANDKVLLSRADQALYEAKRRGRNGYFCQSDDSSWSVPTERT